MILHIPHSSTLLPDGFRVSPQSDLKQELQRMTDWFSDELFEIEDATRVVFALSRLYCDVERFRDDADEMMAQKGMGVCYERDSFGNHFREISQEEKELIKVKHYDTHHKAFTDAVKEELKRVGEVLIVDCHSFSNEVLPHEKSGARADFCIGTDTFHTPDKLTQKAKLFLEQKGYSVAINEPFGGTIVPMEFYSTNKNVHSIMIEINRKLYLTPEFTKSAAFMDVKAVVSELLEILKR